MLVLSAGRRIDLRARLSADGRPPYAVRAFTDLRAHRVDDRADAPAAITPPLWGIATRGPFWHDGRASTLREAIEAHRGEAKGVHDAWAKDPAGQRDLEIFLLTQSRPPRVEWQR